MGICASEAEVVDTNVMLSSRPGSLGYRNLRNIISMRYWGVRNYSPSYSILRTEYLGWVFGSHDSVK